MLNENEDKIYLKYTAGDLVQCALKLSSHLRVVQIIHLLLMNYLVLEQDCRFQTTITYWRECMEQIQYFFIVDPRVKTSPERHS